MRMMKLAAILLSFFTLQTVAYDMRNISITEYEFRRYVRPQLKSISNDFQTLFFALNEELDDYKNTYSLFKEINRINLKARKECLSIATSGASGEISDKCVKILTNMEQLLKKTLKSCSGVNNFESKDIDLLMVYKDSREYLIQTLSHALIKTQNMLFQLRLIGNFGLDLDGYTDQLNYLYDQFNSFLFKNSDPRFKNELNSYWVNFIRPVENYALHQNKQEFFKKHLTEYNIRWNMLNVKLTKRNYQPSKQVATLLNIMHRRWNNILKVSLKPKS
ncbi:MAG: hypothetical protein WD025_06155 [Bacteriovoracaceae bacterium]